MSLWIMVRLQARLLWYLLKNWVTGRNKLVEEIASYMTQAEYHVTPNEIRDKFKEK